MADRLFKSEIYVVGGPLALPAYSGVRILMMPILLEDMAGSAPGFLAAWRGFLVALASMAPCRSGVAYLTIDESVVAAGKTQRRPGLHVDGWADDVQTGAGSGFGGGGGWGGGDPPPINPPDPDDDVKPDSVQPAPKGGCGFLMVASAVGCRAWSQPFRGEPARYGGCEHLRGQFREQDAVTLEPNVVYRLNGLAVHESLPAEKTGPRQFVRLSMPSAAGWPESCTPNPIGVQPGGPILPPRPTAFTAYGDSL